MIEKSTSVQRKPLNDLQKAWRTHAQDHFQNITGKSGSFKAKYKDMKGTFCKYCVSFTGVL